MIQTDDCLRLLTTNCIVCCFAVNQTSRWSYNQETMSPFVISKNMNVFVTIFAFSLLLQQAVFVSSWISSRTTTATTAINHEKIFLAGTSAAVNTIAKTAKSQQRLLQRDSGRVLPSLFAQSEDSGDDEDVVKTEVQILKERAMKARQEASDMERSFAEQKIQSLEELLEKQTSISASEQQYLTDKIDSLKTYLNPATLRTQEAKQKDDPDGNEEEDSIFAKSYGESNQEGKAIGMDEIENVATELGIEVVEEEEKEFVGEISEEEMSFLKEIQSVLGEFQEIMNATKGIGAEEDVDEGLSQLERDLQQAMAGNITREDLELVTAAKGVVDFFNKIPGMEGVLKHVKSEVMEAANFLFEDIQDLEKDDPSYLDKIDSMLNVIPNSMVSVSSFRKAEKINDADIAEFVDNVLLSKTISGAVFKLTSKPRNIKFGYIIEGKPLTTDGNELIDKLDEQLKTSASSAALQEKIQYFYIRDSSTLVGLDPVQTADMIQGSDDERGNSDFQKLIDAVDNLEAPILLVLPKSLQPTPTSPIELRAFASVVALLTTIAFAGDCYSSDNLLESLLSGVAHPTILFGLIGLTIVHELGHSMAAIIHKLKIGFPPTVIPGPTGILGTSTQLLSSPKNNKAFFDFAFLGPLFGLVASWATLAVGLQQTVLVTKSSEIAQLPHLPLDFLKLSMLTSATIETFVGTDVLLSIDPLSNPNVAIHPLVVVGHIGLMVNALAMLPIHATSDGGRMLRSAFSRFSVAVNILSPLIGVFMFVQAFRDWNISGILAFYLIFGSSFDDDVDIPCRNDVDPADGIRAVAWLSSFLVSAIAISPSF